jgi:hypothetical protein
MRAVNRRTVSAWVAILALSLQTLWPLLAQAEPAWSRVVAPVCGIHGGPPVQQNRSPACLLHCALWLSGADRHAAPPPAPIPHLQVALARAPAAAPAAPRFLPSHPASPAQPRAPPALS